jgi:FtsH-binding integral membrane protein
MDVLIDLLFSEFWWLTCIFFLIFVLWADGNAKKNMQRKKERKEQQMNSYEETGMKKQPESHMQGTGNSAKKIDKSLISHLLDVPIWALYFLIVSTVGLTILILAKIWFPEIFVDDFFARILLSYLALIISTVVIAKMTDTIKSVKEKQNS